MIRRWFAVLSTLVLAGCSMAKSELINEMATTGCQSDAGSYYLSKSMIKVVVGGGGPGNFFLKSVGVTHHPDPAYKYCLDYLGSPTSNEAFIVEKTRNGLLSRIYSNSEDQSAQIAKNFAKTIFTAVSQNPNFDERLVNAERSGGSDGDLIPHLSDLFKAEYDPFNEDDAAIVNDALNDFGFCMVIEEVKFERTENIDDYCDHPLGGRKREKVILAGHASALGGSVPPVKETRGILYRPRAAYNFFLFVKRNLQLRGGWELRASEALHMENRSPILSVGVDRAFFTNRKTGLAFDDGVLYDINVDKKSELAGFVEVPLYIAQGIAALPANIVQVKINYASNMAQLENAQQQLVLARKDYNDTLARMKAEEALKPGTKPATNPVSTTNSAGSGANQTGAAGQTSSAPSADGAKAYEQCKADHKAQGDDTDAAESYCQCYGLDCIGKGTGGPAECAKSCSAKQSG